MERSPTLLVLLGLLLLLLWAGAAAAALRRAPPPPPPPPCPAGGGGACAPQTAIVEQPVAAHVVQNRDIHDTSITTGGGLRGVFVPRGAMADIHRSKACVCTRPFCAHPRGRAAQGHEEIMLTREQQARYFPPEAGWACSDMNYPSSA